MVQHKVIVDTSVLLAASLNHICKEEGNIHIQDHFHKMSKPLFDYFEENIEKEQGVITYEIELSARNQISKAFLKKIAQKKRVNFLVLKRNLNRYSFSLIKINDSLNKNIQLLTRVPINEKELKKIVKKIAKFYSDLLKRLYRYDPRKVVKRRVRRVSPALRKFEKGFAEEDESINFEIHPKIKSKLKQNPPNNNDYRILSQAIYMKRRDRDLIVSIASADHHFSKVRLEDGSLHDFIPSEIERRFHIKCGWPEEILNLLKS